MHYLKILIILFTFLSPKVCKPYSLGKVLKIEWENGKSIFKNKKECVSILWYKDQSSYQVKSSIFRNNGIQADFDLLDISTLQNGINSYENWNYLLMFRFDQRIISAKYCVDSSFVTLESVVYINSSPLSTFKGTVDGNESELNIDSLRKVIRDKGDKSKYKLISLRDTLILNDSEKENIRYIHFSSYGDGICDELSDSILYMNLLAGERGTYKRPVGLATDCPIEKEKELEWSESGFYLYFPSTRKFGRAGSDTSTFQVIEKVENGVITFSGIKENRDGVRVRNVARWDSKRGLLIFYEFWPEVVFYPHAYKIEGDLLKLFTSP